MNNVSKNITIKELNKEWREYTRQIDTIIADENIHLPKKNVTFVIRIKKGSGVSLCDIAEDELKKMGEIIDLLNNV